MSNIKAIVLATWIAISGIYNVFDIASWASDTLNKVNIAYIEAAMHELVEALSTENSSDFLGFVGKTRVDLVSPQPVDMTFVQYDARTTAPMGVVALQN
jgi:hypothetical protein